MKLSLNLIESDAQISKLILEQLKNVIENAVNKSIPKIIIEIKNIIANALRSQPEYASLMTGTLKAEFGIPDGSKVNQIIEALVNTINFTNKSVSIKNSGLNGGFVLTMMKSNDLNGIIYIDIASVMDEKGYTLPWLEWLLLRGNESIVKEYSVRYTNSNRSRSGMALMFRSDKNWRVPPEFAGSQTNNWTTRAVERAEQKVYQIIQETIEKNI